MDGNINEKEAMVARIQQLEHERDDLRKDIEQVCMQNAGPSYLAVATKMHFQRTAGLEQEIENLKQKLGVCIRENANLQQELSEAYRVKAEKSKEEVEFVSQKLDGFQQRIEELTSECLEEKKLSTFLRNDLEKKEKENEILKKVVNKFYEIRGFALQESDEKSWYYKCARLLHETEDQWSYGETSTSKCIKSKGVFPSKESKTKREMLVWTTHMDSVFIDSMLFQHREGNHQDGVFSSCAYNDMLKEMNEKFPSINIKKENLKNRLKTIKQNFSKCYDIFRSASNSGIAWNSESKMWEAEPEVWEILIQSKPEATEWRTKTVNKYDELEELFAKDRTNGEGAETAKEKKRRWAKTKANSVCEENTESIDDINFLISCNEVNLEGVSVDLEGDDVEILPNAQPSQVPSQCVSTSSKRKKTETMEEVMKSSLGKIATAIERSADAILENSASLAKFRPRVISSEEITEALEDMGIDGQFFDDAFEFLTDNPEKAKKLFGYPKMGRLAYLKKLIYPF